MNQDLIDLGGFDELHRETKVLSDGREMTRVHYTHNLIIETIVDPKHQQIKLRSNFSWHQYGQLWRPDLSEPNPLFAENEPE